MIYTRTTPRFPASGFTLVETLVAISILMIAVVVPFYSVQQAIVFSYISRDQLIASSLAQEGIEYIRSTRDNNYLSGDAWDDGLSTCKSANGCEVHVGSGTIVACTSGGCTNLRLGPTGLYGYNNGHPETKFKRTVKVEDVDSGEQMKVTVTVEWVTSRRNLRVEVVENLYNWL